MPVERGVFHSCGKKEYISNKREFKKTFFEKKLEIILKYELIF